MFLLMGLVLILNTLFILFLSYILPGVRLYTFYIAILLALFLGLINSSTHYLFKHYNLPHHYLTYSIFSFLSCLIIFAMADKFFAGFKIDSWGWLFSFSLIVALFNGLVHILIFQ